MRNSSHSKPQPNRYLPTFESEHAPFKIITKKPIVPSDYEQSCNPRSRSAKCRIAVRIDYEDPHKKKMDLL